MSKGYTPRQTALDITETRARWKDPAPELIRLASAYLSLSEKNAKAIVVGHFCGTDEELDPGISGSLDGGLSVFWFGSREEAEEWLAEDFWLPDGIILDLEDEPGEGEIKGEV